MDQIDQLLAVKTRLTTIKGYAQLLEREILRLQPRVDRLDARIDELNSEITRLVELVADIESSMADAEDAMQPGDRPAGDGYMSFTG